MKHGTIRIFVAAMIGGSQLLVQILCRCHHHILAPRTVLYPVFVAFRAVSFSLFSWLALQCEESKVELGNNLEGEQDPVINHVRSILLLTALSVL